MSLERDKKYYIIIKPISIMKNLVIVLALLFGFSASFANEGTVKPAKVVDVKALDGLKFKVAIPELNDKGTVFIKNAFGETIYKESIDAAANFVKVYNLAGFPDGEYHFEVKIGGKVISKEVKINTTVNRVAFVN